METINIKIRVIRKLVRWKKWGCSHTENILKGLPSHLRGEKATREALKELTRARWIIPLIKAGEIHYSLKPKKEEEISGFYEEHQSDNVSN